MTIKKRYWIQAIQNRKKTYKNLYLKEKNPLFKHTTRKILKTLSWNGKNTKYKFLHISV